VTSAHACVFTCGFLFSTLATVVLFQGQCNRCVNMSGMQLLRFLSFCIITKSKPSLNHIDKIIVCTFCSIKGVTICLLTHITPVSL